MTHRKILNNFTLIYNLHCSTFYISRHERIVSMRAKCGTDLIIEVNKLLKSIHGNDQYIELISIQNNYQELGKKPLLLSVDGLIQKNINP